MQGGYPTDGFSTNEYTQWKCVCVGGGVDLLFICPINEVTGPEQLC